MPNVKDWSGLLGLKRRSIKQEVKVKKLDIFTNTVGDSVPSVATVTTATERSLGISKCGVHVTAIRSFSAFVDILNL